MGRRKVKDNVALLAVFLIAIISPASLLAESIEVNVTVMVRKGAGGYYEVVQKLPAGTKVEVMEEADGWYKVRLRDKTIGFISKKGLNAKRPDKLMKYDKGDAKGVGDVSSSEIMAATKGLKWLGQFAKGYAKKRGIDEKVLAGLDDVPFSPEEYKKFKEGPVGRGKHIEGLSEEGIKDADRTIGAAVAMRLCAKGISHDEELRKYVSMAGTVLAEKTPLYDEPFTFIVIDSPDVESFALPGGYVFITTGAVSRMKSEAELAGVLGHEIIHVVQRHGIKELEKRETRIKADKAMSELDEEAEKFGAERDEAVVEDLEDMADRLYEMVVSGRTRKSEDEADRYGTMLLYQTGYPSDGLKSYLIALDKDGSLKRETSPTHRSYSERIQAIETVIKENGLTGKGSVNWEERFGRYARR